MSASPSVTEWLGRVKTGDHDAAHQLWLRYIDQLVRLARARLRGVRRRATDEEDVALSAFASFFRGAAAGLFPDLNDRHGLWPLLVAITARKAIKVAAYERRQKRGGGVPRCQSFLLSVRSFSPARSLCALIVAPDRYLLNNIVAHTIELCRTPKSQFTRPNKWKSHKCRTILT